MKKSLLARNNDLANTQRQLEILSNGVFKDELPSFAEKIKETNQFPLQPKKLEILQINVGYMCNQVCAHCHVDAGPDRKEIMTKEDNNMSTKEDSKEDIINKEEEEIEEEEILADKSSSESKKKKKVKTIIINQRTFKTTSLKLNACKYPTIHLDTVKHS